MVSCKRFLLGPVGARWHLGEQGSQAATALGLLVLADKGV